MSYNNVILNKTGAANNKKEDAGQLEYPKANGYRQF